MGDNNNDINNGNSGIQFKYDDALWDDDGFEDYVESTSSADDGAFLTITLVYVLIIVALLYPLIWLRRNLKKKKRKTKNLEPNEGRKQEATQTKSTSVNLNVGNDDPTVVDIESDSDESNYEDLDWAELPEKARNAAEFLGYTADLWDSDKDPEVCGNWWRELTPKQQAAAAVLGFSQEKWDGDDQISSASSSLSSQEELPTMVDSTRNRKKDSFIDMIRSASRRTKRALSKRSRGSRGSGCSSRRDAKGQSLLNDQENSENSAQVGFLNNWGKGVYAVDIYEETAVLLDDEYDSFEVEETIDHVDENDMPQTIDIPKISVLETGVFKRPRIQPFPDDPHEAGEGDNDENGYSEYKEEEEEHLVNYDDCDWDELPQKVKDAAAILGYNKTMWDLDQEPPECDEWWRDLSAAQQSAAKQLGYSQKKWDGEETAVDIENTMTRSWGTLHRVLNWDLESRKLMKLAIPGTIDAGTEPFLDAVEVALIAMNLGPKPYLAYAMAHVFIDLTDSFVMGVGEAEEVLTAQAIGMGNFFNAGQYVQLTTALYILIAIPAYGAWVCVAERVVIEIGLGYEVAHLVRLIMPLIAVAHFTENLVASLDRLMWCAGKGGTMTFIDVSFHGLYILALVIYIYSSDTRSIVVIGWLRIMAAFGYSACMYTYISFKGWLLPYSKGLFRNFAPKNTSLVRGVLKMALPLSIGSLLAHGEWEVLTLFAAHMGPAEVAAWSIVGAIWEVFEFVSSGISTAASIRIGYHLGNGDPCMAKVSAYKSLFYSTIFATFITLFFVSFRHGIVELFTEDETILEMISELIALLGIGNVLMVIGSDAYEIISTQCRAKLATLVYFFAVVFITFPLAAYFVYFKNFGLQSLLFSTVAGYATLALCLLVLVFTSKWPNISAKVISKANAATLKNKKVCLGSTSNISFVGLPETEMTEIGRANNNLERSRSAPVPRHPGHPGNKTILGRSRSAPKKKVISATYKEQIEVVLKGKGRL